MPIDKCRLHAPENTTSYSLYINEKITTTENKNEKNTLYMKMGVVSQAKGSAYIEHNRTKVICSVFDPRKIPHKLEYSVFGELYCEFKYAPFSKVKRRGHQPDIEERALSLSLKRALEPVVCRHEFPNFQVDIYALVLEDGGSSLAAAITCAGLALANASVPMYDLIAASSMVINNDKKIMDPKFEDEAMACIAEDNSNHGVLTLAYMPAHEQITHFKQLGSMDMECIEGGINDLVESCKEIYYLAQKCLEENLKPHLKNKESN